MSNETIDRILEIQNRVQMLEPNDRKVLEDIQHDIDHPWIDFIGISVDLYIVPSDVQESLDHLLELGFISEERIDENSKRLRINENGIDAQRLLQVLYKDS